MRKLASAAVGLIAAAGCLGDNETPLSGSDLRSLAVSPGTLSPGFAADQHDYGVICGEGTTQLAFTATPAHDDAVVTIAGESPTGVVSAIEDQVVTITVTPPVGEPGLYYVRCLPHDFPELDVVRTRPGAAPGWFLFGTINAAFPVAPPYFAVVTDERGAVLWYKRTAGWALDVRRRPDGTLQWYDDSAVAVEQHQLDGSLVKAWRTAGTDTDPHDAVPLPNGNLLFGSYHQRSGVDVSVLAPAFTGTTNVLDAWLQEMRPDGTVAWEWHSEDHLGIIETVAHLDGITLKPDPLDLVHWNSLELDGNGDLIMSARHTDAVYKIRRNPGGSDDGAVIWKLGGNDPTEAGAVHLTIVGDPYGGPARQHDARLHPGGTLTVFDNRTGRADHQARGVEYQIDEGAGTATMVWQQLGDDGPSCCMGDLRRAADGTNLIGWGAATPIFTDYGEGGVKLVDATGSAWSYRVVLEPAASFDRAELRAQGGGDAAVSARRATPGSAAEALGLTVR